MGNNSFAPILGSGSAVIAINGKHILIREYLHVPALCTLSTFSTPINVSMDVALSECNTWECTSSSPHSLLKSTPPLTATSGIWYALIGRAATMSSLDYVQPIQAQNFASATASTPLLAPAIIEADDGDVPPKALPTYASHWPKKPLAPPAPPVVLPFIPPPAYSICLKDLTRKELIQCIYSV